MKKKSQICTEVDRKPDRAEMKPCINEAEKKKICSLLEDVEDAQTNHRGYTNFSFFKFHFFYVVNARPKEQSLCREHNAVQTKVPTRRGDPTNDLAPAAKNVTASETYRF